MPAATPPRRATAALAGGAIICAFGGLIGLGGSLPALIGSSSRGLVNAGRPGHHSMFNRTDEAFASNEKAMDREERRRG
jgi:hypothetical protein